MRAEGGAVVRREMLHLQSRNTCLYTVAPLFEHTCKMYHKRPCSRDSDVVYFVYFIFI